jgi:hypothetical protein
LAAQVDERSTARSSQRLAVQPARQPAATKESIINELPLKHHTTARYGIPGSIFLWPKQKFNICRRKIPLIHAKLLEAREEPTGNILCASNTTRSTNVSQAQDVSLKNFLCAALGSESVSMLWRITVGNRYTFCEGTKGVREARTRQRRSYISTERTDPTFRIQRLLYKLVQRRSYATSVKNTTCDPMLVRWIRHRFADGDI